MKVLIQNRDYSTHFGGDQVMTDGLAGGLRELGHEVDYSHEWSSDLSNYDIVHLWHLNMGWTHFQAENCLRQNKPYVITTIFYSDGAQDHVRFIADNAKTIISNSRAEADEVIAATDNAEKVVVLPNGTNEEFLKRDVFIAGRYEDFKGQLKVIRACKKLGIPVLTAGSLGDAKYKQQCIDEGYGRVMDNLSTRQMRNQYRRTRVYVCASLHERNSMTATEAQAVGCKLLVTTGNRGNAEVKPDMTFDPNNQEELEQKLKELYFDYPISFKELAGRYVEIYEKAIG